VRDDGTFLKTLDFFGRDGRSGEEKRNEEEVRKEMEK